MTTQRALSRCALPPNSGRDSSESSPILADDCFPLPTNARNCRRIDDNPLSFHKIALKWAWSHHEVWAAIVYIKQRWRLGLLSNCEPCILNTDAGHIDESNWIRHDVTQA